MRQITPGAAVKLARIAVGSLAAVEAIATAPVLRLINDPTIIRVPILPLLPRVTGSAVPVFVLLWAGAAVAFAAGFMTRTTGSVLLLVLGYILLLDQQTYSNHLYLLALLTGILTFVTHAPDAAWIMKAQITIVYLFAGVSKINPAFISGIVIAGALKPATPGSVAIPDAWRVPAFLVPVALATIATELWLAQALWSAKWRRTAAVIGAGLHGGTVLLMTNVQPLIVFGAACLATYPLFFAAEESPMEGAGSAADLHQSHPKES